ncbi:MAG: LysR family transcriptional regulator [Alphaproteobacteria bacterium]
MTDRLIALRAFVHVAECGSFSRAAERLRCSKSVISRLVGGLESELGARLFHRTTRALTLTEAGRGYFERVERILGDLADADRSVHSLQAAPRGRLRVNAPMSFGFLHLAPALPDFLSRYPDIEIEMIMNDRYVELVEEGFDLAVRLGRLEDSRLVARRIAADATGHLCKRITSPRAAPDDAGRPVEHECLGYTLLGPAQEWRFLTPDGKVGDPRARAASCQ